MASAFRDPRYWPPCKHRYVETAYMDGPVDIQCVRCGKLQDDPEPPPVPIDFLALPDYYPVLRLSWLGGHSGRLKIAPFYWGWFYRTRCKVEHKTRRSKFCKN